MQAQMGVAVGQILREDTIAVIEIDGKHVECTNFYNLSGKPNDRCIVGTPVDEHDVPILLAVRKK